MKTTEYINSKIIKYQNPAQGIQRRDNTYIQPPIDRTPIIRTDESGKPWNELSTTERASLNVRQGRNPITSKPIARGNLEISSPEFDIMAGIRGIPFNKLLGKAGEVVEQGLAKSGNRWARNRVVGRAINNEVNKATSIGDLLKGRGFGESNNFKLPDYATPNSTANPIDLHALRLSNGGFDKLPRTVDGKTHFNTGSFSWPYKSESMTTNLYSYDRNPTKWADNLSADFSKASKGVASPDELRPWALDTSNKETLFATSSTGNIYAGRQGLTSTAKEFGEGNINRLLSHEMDHAIHVPGEPPKGFDLNYLTKSTRQPEYFTTKNSTELSARGSQLKDYFGLTSPDQELTEDMLRYAAKNYVKDTGADNNMTAFFNSITDWKEAAKWLSKWSTMIAAPVVIANKSK